MNHSGIRGFQRRRIDTGGLALHQFRVRQALQHPREDRFMRLNVDEGDACGRLSNGPAVRWHSRRDEGILARVGVDARRGDVPLTVEI
jgi:hypothetical protein